MWEFVRSLWSRKRSRRVDFIKLDVEGAELSALKGAPQLLHGQSRPVILAEVQDIRTKRWGYRASEVVRYLSNLNYRWFQLLPGGSLEKLDAGREEYDGNFVAVPEERLDSVLDMVTGTSGTRQPATGSNHSEAAC